MEKIILNEDQNAVGWLWFIPNEQFEEGKPCTGWGKERYGEGSVFEGQVKYDGKKFYRQGFGIQDFTYSYLIGNCPLGMVFKTFYGLYDSENGYPWMIGNGVMYCVDEVTGKPAGFVKGFFNALNVSEWHGEFDYNNLLSGYTKDMEIKLIPYQRRRVALMKKHGNAPCEYLFLGDSWVEMWEDEPRYGVDVFGRDTADLDAINVGIGGTKYSDWLDWIDELILPHNPKYIFINLGFNDIHTGQSVDFVYDNMVKLVTEVKKALPEVKFYFTANVLCSPFVQFFDKEREFNRRNKEFCDKNSDYCKFIDVYKLFTVNDQMIPNMDDICIEDNLHFNLEGYNIWSPYVIDFIKNNKF